MFLFPLAYIVSFLYGLSEVFKRQVQGLLVFILVGLPIYINALSVSFMYGYVKWIPLLQSFKEILVLATFTMVALSIKNIKQIKWHVIDILIIVFFIYSLLYVFLPIGSYSVGSKLLALKSLSFFPFLYFIGRFCAAETVTVNKLFSFLVIMILAAAIVVVAEKFFNQHLHTRTGYMAYNTHYFDADVSGNYGLQWTFQTESGLKRFGSIFSNPLEFAAGIVLGLSILLALITYKQDRLTIQANSFEIAGIIACLVCIFLAASRASFLSFFLLVYCYGWITQQKKALFYFHTALVLVVMYVYYFLEGDFYDLIMDTLTFQSTSSAGHVLEWIAGIDAMTASPFGLGLGQSGRVASVTKDNIGGENQFIIIGVQVGVLAMFLYLSIYIMLIREGIKNLKTSVGKNWKVFLAVVLIKIGLFLPMFTAYVDSYIYISYFSWFLSGYMINLIQQSKVQRDTIYA